MKRTGRTLVILTLAAWLAALTPALAAPRPVGDDPVRIGVGIGGDIIDVLNHDEDGDEGNGDENGDENGDGLLDGLVALLLGNGEEDDDENHDGVVGRVLEVLVGEEDDSVDAAPTPAAAVRPADDDEGLIGDLLELPEDVELLEDVGDGVEDVLESTADAIEVVVCILDRVLNKPPSGAYIPCALP